MVRGETKGRVPWVLLAWEGRDPTQGAPPAGLTSTHRFCGLIQALVTNPDSTAPSEEAEGVREVLEVRKGPGSARRGKANGLNPVSAPPAV